MKVEAKNGKAAFEVNKGDHVLLKTGETAEVISVFQKTAIVQLNEKTSVVGADDIIEVVKAVVQTVGLITRIIQAIKSWFKK